MAWIKNTGCKYHTQDTEYYCGAATAMMVLAEIGVPHANLDQDDLYSSNHNHNVQNGWASDPEGLRFTMVDQKPATFQNTFVVYRSASEAAGSQKLVYTLQQYGVSPIVLVFDCMHWIVVCGVQTDVNPATGPYTIEGFWVNNSVYVDPEDPHAGGDACGSGGWYGVENQWVSYAEWQRTYFTGCAYGSADGSRQFISVCDPDVPKIALPRRVEPVRYYGGRTIISERDAMKSAAQDLKRLGLDRSKQAARLASGRLSKPYLVERLDAKNQYYYLAPSTADGAVIGWAQVDARFGSLQSVYPLKRPAKALEVDPRRIAKQIAGRRIELPNEEGGIKLVPGKFAVERRLVWRPCRESFSPHLPFWQITAGPFRLYQRIDGPIFAQLTTEGRGV